MQKLFFTRLALYLIALLIPVFHPAVAVTYDTVSRWTWFVLVPIEMLLAFYAKPPRTRFWLGPVLGLAALLVLAFVQGGWTRGFFLVVAAGSFGYIWTRLVFSRGGRGYPLAVIELFAIVAIYYRLLSFARASEEIARESSRMTVIVLIVAVTAFLLHALVLYLAAFPERSTMRRRKELAIFFAVVLPLSLTVAILLPSDFVKHSIVFNGLDEEPPPTPQRLDGEGIPRNQGGGASQQQKDPGQNGLPLGDREDRYPSERNRMRGGEEGRESVPRGPGGGGEGGDSGEGQGNGHGGQSSRRESRNHLEGIPSDQWDNQGSGDGQGKGQGKGKQKAVMIIASKVDPVYAAEAYRGDFEGEKGFQINPHEKLNDLVHERLLETWQHPPETLDLKRKSFSIYYLSTIKNRVLAYRPVKVEPTVQNTIHHPFDLSYNASSEISVSSPDDWKDIEGLNEADRRDLAFYLKANISPAERSRFQGYLKRVLKGKSGYFDRIETILKSLSDHQYELGYDENMTVAKLDAFLFRTKKGDCTEFSNTVALLGRLAGIPSRVVTGYIASRDLQTPAHRRGVYILRQKIPELQKYPLNDLYLVTTSHHHSWVQFYMPGYGWIDFESTAFAIPPRPEMDPNNEDVVIPMLKERQIAKPKTFHFPWRLASRVLGGVLFLTILSLYLYRYGRELFLFLRSRGESEAALRALYLLLFMRLAENGFPLKKPDETPLEYAESHPDLKRFGQLYTMLRFRENYDPGEKEEGWKELRNDYRRVVRAIRRPGWKGILLRRLNLRGLYYN